MSGAAEIVFDRVSKRYPGRSAYALHDLSLTIPAGTFCVLVGPSGGGKTTATSASTAAASPSCPSSSSGAGSAT